MLLLRMRFQRCPFPRTKAWKRLLQFEGYRVLTASDGHSGLVVAREGRPDLIITGRTMPIMGGVEFCHQLKLEQALARIPLILISAGPLKSGDTTQWDEFWQKPVAIDTI
ncbi:response regulator [Paraburkholderia sp. RL17-347-BIC-D]|uniref:response regulator n=1 Tax=Paraburkholderia sp. RL17-347-BIC-D TaxID=3031632 RepID=UPI0038B9BF30